MTYIKKLHKLFLPICFSFLVSLACCFIIPATAQAPVLQTTNVFTQQSVLYNSDTFTHTAWKPILYMDSTYRKSNRSWLYRKFFEEHLVQVQEPGLNIFADAYFDENIGVTKRAVPTIFIGTQNTETSKMTYVNTRGYNLSGNVGEKFYFQTDLYETQARLPGYVDSLVRTSRIVPFQARYKNFNNKGFDYAYSSAKLIYIPNKHLLFNLGYGTNFIGDGYRSLLLSDYNTNYPYFRTAISFGNFQYSVMYSEYIADRVSYTYAQGYPRKWGQTYLLDWRVTKNFNVGIFNAVVSAIENDEHKNSFGFTHFSPIIFVHGSKSPSGVKNKDIYGLNVKYTVIPAINVYAQLMLDKLGSESWQKRYGYQVGIRTGNLFNVDGLTAQAEFNTVRPYSYASDTITTAYGHNNEALAHPLGANFKEGIFVADYYYKRWWFRLEAMAASYGLDSTASVNYGKNIFKPLYLHSSENNASTGGGLSTKLYFGDVKVAYILNKKTNLRVEAGAGFRSEKNALRNFKDAYFYFGIRHSFRRLVYDF